MTERQQLAKIGLREAIVVRREAKLPLNEPVCIYDLAEKVDAEVWFVGGSSFAGMYAKGDRRLFVPAERPAGRRAFTCAHELAHLRFKHGTRVEELDFDQDDRKDPDEQLANLFAGYLLMPRAAVVETFTRLSADPRIASKIEIYAAACQLGVGYSTLLNHLCYSLDLISRSRLAELARYSVKELRVELLGVPTGGRVVVATRTWKSVPVDLEIGDHAILPPGAKINGPSARLVGESPRGTIVEAVTPGLTQAISGSDWATIVRVSRRNFVGRAAYRHLEDLDPDEY